MAERCYPTAVCRRRRSSEEKERERELVARGKGYRDKVMKADGESKLGGVMCDAAAAAVIYTHFADCWDLSVIRHQL